MARTYHIDIACFAADAHRKWVDNLLSSHVIPGAEHTERGVARRLSQQAVHTIALVHRLNHDLGVSVDTGVALAIALLSGHADHVAIGDALELRFDRAGFRHKVDRRIEEAVESIVPARRGRPAVRP